MSRVILASRQWRAAFVIGGLVPLLAVGIVFWRAAQAKKAATAEVLSQSDMPFRIVPVDRTPPANMDVLAAVPGFRDIALFQDFVIVSAQSGLLIYDRNGTLIRSYRAGMELPAAELGTMSSGIAAGSAAPELFIATHGEGILAFTGSRFRQILPADPSLRAITSVLVLRSGRILFGTEGRGLLEFDGQRISPFHSRLKTAHITALAGNDGNLWVGTLSDGLFHYRAGQLEELLPALPDPQVLSLSLDQDTLYAGTPLGVVEFRSGARQRVLGEGFFARAIAPIGDTLQVGTEDEGIVGIPLRSRLVSRASSDAIPAAEPILRIAKLDGDLYALGESTVYRYEAATKRWRSALTSGPSVMSDRNVTSLAFSGERLWVGYFDRGLDIVDASMERATHHQNDTLFCVNRIVPDPQHSRTAVATANGLVLFDSSGQPRQIMGRKDGFLSGHVTDVAFRDEGMVVATPAGLSFVDRSGVRSLYVFHGLVNNHVYTIATQGTETAAGTLGGLSLLDGDSVRANFTTANSHLKHNWITALVRLDGDWFAGTYGAGVLRLDASGEWHSFPELKEGFVVNPNAMLVRGNNVFAGTLDRGLLVYDRSSRRWTNTVAGLPSKNVTALAAAGGALYIGTDNGVVRVRDGGVK